MSIQELLPLAVEILEGLDELHDMNIWHLDLKPANILLDKHQHAYLADFGISVALQTLQECTELTSWAGTPHYLSAPHPFCTIAMSIANPCSRPCSHYGISCCKHTTEM